MKVKSSDKGFSVIEAIIIVVVLAILVSGGWYFWQKTRKTEPTAQSSKTTSQTSGSHQSASQEQQPTDPSEGGKYLVIKEWGVRVALPQDMQGKLSYKINRVTDPDSGLPLEAADLYVLASAFGPNDCAQATTDIGSSIYVTAFYIRSDTSKSFNASRYHNDTFKENILVGGQYAYHLDYITPDCLGGGTFQAKIEALQAALVNLRRTE